VGPGEILGFAGVGGNGLGVLEAVLGGFLHPATGTIHHRGRDISRFSTRRLRGQGLAYVPADRLRVGSALGATVDENLIIGRRREFSPGGFLNQKAIREFSAALTGRYRIAGSGGAVARNGAALLSGGNLQKLILAREIDRLKDYIVFSEPTWGLDVGGRDFVWGEIAALRKRRVAVILISTDLDEILALADRIIVLYRGRLAGELANNGDPAIKEHIGGCMQGLPPQGAAR
jgi:simple sugar transport system ATP-binding protein